MTLHADPSIRGLIEQYGAEGDSSPHAVKARLTADGYTWQPTGYHDAISALNEVLTVQLPFLADLDLNVTAHRDLSPIYEAAEDRIADLLSGFQRTCAPEVAA